jgi:hypothetical protein
MHRNRSARLLTRAILAGVAIAAVSMSAPAYASGNVLPPTAQPHGTSLTDMAHAFAPFTFSGNDPDLLPNTPFQALYGDPSTITYSPDGPDGSGLLESGSNTFTVRPGTSFYVPVFNVDDSPPPIGTFPTTNAQAQHYLFDPNQLGGQDFQVVIDGTTTPLGPEYVAGPVTTAPLADGATHTVTLGAFLPALTPGTHTVSISGGIFGALVPPLGFSFLRIAFTYNVTVAH